MRNLAELLLFLSLVGCLLATLFIVLAICTDGLIRVADFFEFAAIATYGLACLALLTGLCIGFAVDTGWVS